MESHDQMTSTPVFGLSNMMMMISKDWHFNSWINVTKIACGSFVGLILTGLQCGRKNTCSDWNAED